MRLAGYFYLGEHKGMTQGNQVASFFGSMMPAIRAQASTSPFFVSPDSIKASVSGFIEMKPSACAIRFVSFFGETSTMCASPLELM